MQIKKNEKSIIRLPLKGENRAIAPSVYQSRSSGQHDIGFVDNRPEAITQRKMHNIFNVHSKVGRIIENNGRPAPQTMQLKALVANKLNVAGELHNISGNRRPDEKQYAKANNVNNYWTEHEFEKGASDLLDFGENEMGDPTLLCYESARLLSHWRFDTYLNDRRDAPYDFIKAQNNLDVVGASLQQMIGFKKKMGTQPKNTKAYILSMFNEESQLLSMFTQAKAYIGNGTISAQQRRVGLDNYITKTLLNDKLNASLTGNDETWAAFRHIASKRSDWMHATAKHDATTNGLWKVGDAHITDIKDEYGDDEITYNILTKDEFDEDYTPWRQEQLIIF